MEHDNLETGMFDALTVRERCAAVDIIITPCLYFFRIPRGRQRCDFEFLLSLQYYVSGAY